MREYSVIDCFWGDYAQIAIMVNKKLKWGLINRSGEEIIPAIYDGVQYVGGEVAFVNIGYRATQRYEYSGKWGIVNLKNETVVPLSYSNVFPWNNRAIVCRRNRWGIIDYTGNIIIPLKYEGLFSSGIDDFFICKMNEKYGLIDRVGTILIPSIYDDIKATVQFDKKSWFVVCKENKWYYINRKGETVLKISDQ